ncbi:glucose-6-phosphate isomerase [Pararhodobacter sp. SW119]|uniref:glucose-6-phosphate isomerase n=1 Tax=Pararhodobacter sp. SW119 TaxID=2780075 RepID=UPI001ADF6BC0|nr:glucose-6-phosphate isomerase [Pararhodobacter sp. SW119]
MDPWTALDARQAHAADRPIAALFDDSGRAADFSISLRADPLGEMFFDYSKTSIDAETRAVLLELAQATGVEARRDAMFAGAPINATEGRAVLHTALRNLDGAVTVDGVDVMPQVRATLERMEGFARDLRDGRIRGAGGRITDVVNIGIGGSDLGPAMAVQALAPYCDGPRCHFVSNVDGAHVHDTLDPLNPETTLVIVASKTFTTTETMTNARTARDWIARGGDPARQFVALSSATDRTTAFGIDPGRVFSFEDWVGGRYSVWGPIGLSLMIAIGPDHFRAFLAGAAAMDRHFRTTPLQENMPAMLALVGIWHHQVCGHPTRAVLPYDQRLARLPAYLQQLEMESNGKRVEMDGATVAHATGPVVWGEPGTNGQHAFFQLLHQGTQVVPCEFLLAARGHEPALAHHHALLIANCLAQAEALMRGRTEEEARARASAAGLRGKAAERMARHRSFPGNRPSTLLVYPKLTPAVLGAILALYEHRVFVEGTILGINSFDQWGVELGKELAESLVPMVEGRTEATGRDGSTLNLLATLNRLSR